MLQHSLYGSADTHLSPKNSLNTGRPSGPHAKSYEANSRPEKLDYFVRIFGERKMTEVARRILEAAIAEFAQYGYDGARLARIAQAVGVHTAQIHYYFGSKKELYQEVQKHLHPVETNSITEVLIQGERPLPERIQAFYERFGSFVQNFHRIEGGDGVSMGLLPPLLKSPKALSLPAWEETLLQAQRFGMIRNLPLSIILAHQWSVAMTPLWFMPDKTQWPSYYQNEAPVYFWALAKNIP